MTKFVQFVMIHVNGALAATFVFGVHWVAGNEFERSGPMAATVITATAAYILAAGFTVLAPREMSDG